MPLLFIQTSYSIVTEKKNNYVFSVTNTPVNGSAVTMNVIGAPNQLQHWYIVPLTGTTYFVISLLLNGNSTSGFVLSVGDNNALVVTSKQTPIPPSQQWQLQPGKIQGSRYVVSSNNMAASYSGDGYSQVTLTTKHDGTPLSELFRLVRLISWDLGEKVGSLRIGYMCSLHWICIIMFLFFCFFFIVKMGKRC